MIRAASCQRCENLCAPPTHHAGVLHFRFPLTHTFGKVRSVLAHSGWEYTERNGIVSINVAPDASATIVHAFQKVLTAHEQIDTRVIFQPAGQPFALEDAFGMTSLVRYASQIQSEWLVTMLREERLTSAFQPIVAMDTPEQVFAYECLMRGMDGDRIISPYEILNVARGADLLFQLDLAARRSAIVGASQHGLTSKIFINFNPTAIYDPAYCLRSTIRTIDELQLSNEQIVFEVVESDDLADTNHLKNIVEYYRKVGFQVALDDLGSGFSSLNLLHELRPDYVKLDMQLIRDVYQDPFKAAITRKLLEVARELGIRTIAEGIETADEYTWLRDHGADYAQGYFIAKPALVPPIPPWSINA